MAILTVMWLQASRVMVCLTSALFVLSAWPAASAQAATYTVWSCRGPDGTPISTAAWNTIAGGVGTQDGCAAGGALTARLLESDTLPGRGRGYTFALPSGAVVSGYRIHMYAATDSRGPSGASQAGLDDAAQLTPEQIDAGCPSVGCTFGVPDPALSAANLVTAQGIESGGLALATICGRQNGCARDGQSTLAEVRMFRSEVDVRDDDAPSVGTSLGMPAEGEVLSANRAVSFGASDIGGGVMSLWLLVDGNEVARQDAGGTCAQPYTRPAPCPAQLALPTQLNVSALGAGPHTVSMHAVDAAGNAATSAPVTFRVAAPVSPVAPTPTGGPLAQNPANGTTTSTSQAAGPLLQVLGVAARSVTITASHDRIRVPGKQKISGVVRDSTGRPVAGAMVTVRSRPFGVRRVKLRLERTVTTDAGGRFVAPAGATSRLVVLDVSDDAHRALEEAEVKVLRRLLVSAQTVRRNLRNGATMTLRADLGGAGSGADDKVVLIQTLVQRRWTTVGSVNAGSDGKVLWRYRFRATTRRTSYRFRVKVERAGDVWPWPTTVSRVVRVEVSP